MTTFSLDELALVTGGGPTHAQRVASAIEGAWSGGAAGALGGGIAGAMVGGATTGIGLVPGGIAGALVGGAYGAVTGALVGYGLAGR